MTEKKVVSKFEYAIMLAAHESDPTKVTKEDLDKIRPVTDAEALRIRKDNIERQIKRFKFKP